MKKILFTSLILLLILPFKVNAASASISARASSSTVVTGNTVTVTVTVSSSSPLGSWEFVVNYDSTKLQLTSSSFGGTYVADVASNASTTSRSYTYKFKALKASTTNVSIKNYSVLGWDEQLMSTSPGTAYLTLVNPTVVVLSTNANLRSLSLSKGTLSPAFAVDTLEYNVDITELVDKITINATQDDAKASVNGAGEVSVSEGANKFDVKVTAENGTTKIYKITVNVIDSNPIKVRVNSNDYTVIKKSGTLTVPNNYKQTIIPISGIDVVAYENELTKLVLVGLKNTDGESGLYTYDANKELYSPYNEFTLSQVSLFIYEPKVDVPKGFKKATLKINDITVNGYKLDKNVKKDYYLVYAMNINTGKSDFYSYDNVEHTFQRYNDEELTKLKDASKIYIISLLGSLLIIISLVVISIFQLKKYNKLIKKVENVKAKIDKK